MNAQIVERERLSAGLSGVAGEYFVAAELSRRGYIAALTLKNARGIDILASSRDRSKAVTIQVKSMRESGKEWTLGVADEKPLGPRHFYIFVALHGLGKPEYHIVPCKQVATYCRDYHVAWIKGKKRDGSDRKNTDMRSFRPGTEYKDKWELLELDA